MEFSCNASVLVKIKIKFYFQEKNDFLYDKNIFGALR